MVFKTEAEAKDDPKVFKSFYKCFQYWKNESNTKDDVKIKKVFEVSEENGGALNTHFSMNEDSN